MLLPDWPRIQTTKSLQFAPAGLHQPGWRRSTHAEAKPATPPGIALAGKDRGVKKCLGGRAIPAQLGLKNASPWPDIKASERELMRHGCASMPGAFGLAALGRWLRPLCLAGLAPALAPKPLFNFESST
nr:hypothetical protein [uncultured Roseateles sp.]